MDKLTAEIIKEQIIGSTNGHMALIPNSPILYSIFYVFKKNKHITDDDNCFVLFIKEIYETLKEEAV